MTDEVIFKYKFKEDYNPTYVNGAYGGVSCRGEIMVHFFTERFPIPYAIKNELIDGKPGKEIEKEPDGNLILRMIETGVSMNIESAKEFHRWLGEQIIIHDEEFN